ncbi:Anaphase-promoting complex subunit 4-like [Oopsacas minuta]|uniref:Anaphase-promoting complex subunit 4 n=1 Tax=Oopsacas minuta TaxID=111878 RepID=A0AAV7JTL4_9METZ|nr:Anaphase-promoting complex subunit 4-like [Oopsacas minuta]
MSEIPLASNIEILYERRLSTTISLICWSPNINVFAFASEAGDLYLFRYIPWQKVWEIPPREDHTKFTVLEWSRDELMLAGGKDNGNVEIYHIEKGTLLFQFSISAEVTCLSWSIHEVDAQSDLLTSLKKCNDDFHAFFGPLPKLESVDELCRVQETLFEPNLLKKFAKQNTLSILLIGSKIGEVWLNIDGLFCPSFFKLHSEPTKITALKISNNLNDIFITHSDEQENISVCLAKTCFFKQYNHEIRVFSQQFKIISFLLQYMSTVINVMSESYEAVLTKLDEKLAKFVELLPDDVLVVDEFLKLLSMGNNRPEILPFISRDLSFSNPRNKKLPNDIETSHQNLTSVIKNHLLLSSEMLYYKLIQVQKVCKIRAFDKLGYKSDAFESCSMLTGTFMLKTFELLHVTQSSKESFQVFFEWINIVGDRIQGIDQNSNKTLTMKQYEILIEFLMSQLKQSGTPPYVKFNVELVEQYFMPKDLSCQQRNNSPWLKMAEEILPQDFPLIRPDPSSSLLQIMQSLLTRVKDSFLIASGNISQEIFKNLTHNKIKTVSASTKPIFVEHKNAMLVIITLTAPLEKYILILRYAFGEFYYTFISLTGLEGSLSIDSICEYNDLCFAVMVNYLDERKDSYSMFIISFDVLLDAKYFSFSYDFPEDIDEIALQVSASSCVCLTLDRFKVSTWTVSSSRKLAGFVYQDKKSIRLYNLDGSGMKKIEEVMQESMDESLSHN